MQFQSHLLGVPVVRPKVTETTALGAAYLAGLAVGYWKDQKQIAAQWQVDRRFTHAMNPAQRTQLEAGWRKALERGQRWEEAEGDRGGLPGRRHPGGLRGKERDGGAARH